MLHWQLSMVSKVLGLHSFASIDEWSARKVSYKMAHNHSALDLDLALALIHLLTIPFVANALKNRGARILRIYKRT